MKLEADYGSTVEIEESFGTSIRLSIYDTEEYTEETETYLTVDEASHLMELLGDAISEIQRGVEEPNETDKWILYTNPFGSMFTKYITDSEYGNLSENANKAKIFDSYNIEHYHEFFNKKYGSKVFSKKLD